MMYFRYLEYWIFSTFQKAFKQNSLPQSLHQSFLSTQIPNIQAYCYFLRSSDKAYKVAHKEYQVEYTAIIFQVLCRDVSSENLKR